jgi:Protein phosphatase 2C
MHIQCTQPSRKDEAQRIESAGGYVSRGCVNGVLRVTRSFGDIHCKVIYICVSIAVLHVLIHFNISAVMPLVLKYALSSHDRHCDCCLVELMKRILMLLLMLLYLCIVLHPVAIYHTDIPTT